MPLRQDDMIEVAAAGHEILTIFKKLKLRINDSTRYELDAVQNKIWSLEIEDDKCMTIINWLRDTLKQHQLWTSEMCDEAEVGREDVLKRWIAYYRIRRKANLTAREWHRQQREQQRENQGNNQGNDLPSLGSTDEQLRALDQDADNYYDTLLDTALERRLITVQQLLDGRKPNVLELRRLLGLVK